MKKKTKDSDISREARTEEVAFPNLPPSNEGWRDVPPMWVGVEEVGQETRQQRPKGEQREPKLKNRYGRGEQRKQGR